MPKTGRPRSEQARCRILEAALHLARTEGYGSITMDEIAARARAGKQTIYRWWRSKAELVLEALTENARVEIDVPDTGSLHKDLRGFLSSTFALQRRRPGIQDVLKAMMAEVQLDRDFAGMFRRDFVEPRRDALREIFARAQARGEIEGMDGADLWIDIAFGVLWYRLLVPLGPLDDALADHLSVILSAAAGSRPKNGRARTHARLRRASAGRDDLAATAHSASHAEVRGERRR